MSEINWAALQDEAESAGVLPDGDYTVIVTSAKSTTSSNGKPMIKLKLNVTSGPRKDAPVWTQFVLSPESPIALRMWFLNLAAFGLGADFFRTNPTMDSIASNLMNRGALVTVGSREWQGAMRNEVKGVKVLPADGPPIPGMVTGLPAAGPSPMNSASPLPSPVPTTPSPSLPASPSPVPAGPATAPPDQPF